MSSEITIPSPGESITEVVVGRWHRAPGDWVDRDDIIVEIESDKVTLEVPAPESGVLGITASEGTDMAVGDDDTGNFIFLTCHWSSPKSLRDQNMTGDT